jgi:hypothetical protein
MTEQHDLQTIYQTLMDTTNDLLEEHDPLAIAACMMSQALSIYRTALDEEDFNRIVDNISAQRDKVRILTQEGSLH